MKIEHCKKHHFHFITNKELYIIRQFRKMLNKMKALYQMKYHVFNQSLL